MRSVPRRERHRRLRNAKDCARRYHSPTPQIFDRLELLDQQLNYALPVGIISQAIITTDNYLGYSLSHYLFSGKRTAAFRSLDDISLWIEKGSLRQLIVDMETLPVSCIEALNQLRALSWQQSDIQIYLLVSDKTAAITQFIRMAGRFFVLSRRQNLASVREALLSAAEPRLSESFSRTDWLMIETLAQGASLKEIARQQSVSYHRVVYRLKQLITLLNLPHRQSFLRLIQQLNVTFHDIF
ncbi:fimbria biosynthesis regulator FimY [Salmonella enterica subsp. enterica serovar Rubislaw]|nr:fimbria biosynthesis regulator FimY [Salmonella enterica]EDK9568848.1 fimbria biosynthesis regulator FimY [Salmonella enterica subsp. enterica serovar Rubislaw]EDZ8039028.1 fimbria biosynthesis regulator FimY [Salmonella enterica]EHF7639671.1 fimbria biosynthesis regulator FimY [Salmonella enterica]ELG2080831.1 fimbria biosynthesis regulator FimY [Salmonella enterica]